MRKKLLIVASAMVAIITLSIGTYVWFVGEDLTIGNQESPPNLSDIGSLEGVIVDQEGIPLAGIEVSIINGNISYPETTVETNEEGYYQIEGIPPGQFEVALFDKQKNRIEVENVTVISGETSIVDFNITSNSICPSSHSSYKWTPIGTFSENFNWKCLQCGHSWTEILSEEEYESWKNKFLEPDFVRDYTLLYLRSILQTDVPDPLILEWVGGRETPEQILGYETFIYKAEDITVTIGYPLVLPEDTIYNITVQVGDLSIWKGQLHCREFAYDSKLENILYDYYSGVGLFEKGIHVSATTRNPLIREATTETSDTNVLNSYWQQIYENLTDRASSEDFISIIISRGDYSTGGYEIKIRQFSWLECDPVEFLFQTDFIDPDEGIAVTQAFTNPLVLFPVGKLSPGEYQIEVYILQYILSFNEEGNPTYTQLLTFKEEVWTKTFIIQ